METEIKQLKAELEKRDRDGKETMRSMEHKVLQEKTLLKKEMIEKVTDVVTSFRKLSDRSMTEASHNHIVCDNAAVDDETGD